MKITAHRGISSLAPENTLAAFNKAADYNCKWIEIDVQLSQDNVPVVIHDKTVDRCSDGSGFVSEMTLTDLKLLDAGRWFSNIFRKERIPTLKETLILAKNKNLKVNIEIKHYPAMNTELLCEKIKELIIDLKIAPSEILLSSFNIEALKQMQSILPHIRRGQIWPEIPPHALSLLTEIEAYSVHCDYRYLNEQQALMVKKAGYQLYCFTANSPEQVNQHWNWGVDMMITDRPQAYL